MAKKKEEEVTPAKEKKTAKKTTVKKAAPKKAATKKAPAKKAPAKKAAPKKAPAKKAAPKKAPAKKAAPKKAPAKKVAPKKAAPKKTVAKKAPAKKAAPKKVKKEEPPAGPKEEVAPEAPEPPAPEPEVEAPPPPPPEEPKVEEPPKPEEELPEPPKEEIVTKPEKAEPPAKEPSEPKPGEEKPPEPAPEAEKPPEKKPPVKELPPEDVPLLFDTWDFTEVEVEDMGLRRYINLTPIYIPHTGAKHANKRFGREKVNIVERLINNTMRTERFTGKKSKAFMAVRRAFEIIQKKSKTNPIQVLVYALQNAAPREEITRLRFGGISVPRAVDIAPSRRLDLAIRNICKGAVASTHKNKKPIEACLADEILMAANEDISSFSISKKEELERVAVSAR
ncbi:MAG: 30S ribosomal protein S7 [Thermoplasmata archaeon]|nr:30S ribosomal protein S7 [Thermoplasmata archaeon]